MSSPFKIDVLPQDAQVDIIKYATEHSLRETEKYVLDKYGLELSHVSIKSLVARFKGFISDAEIRLKNRVILESEEVISRFNDLYMNEKSAKGKLLILSKEAEFLKELTKNLPNVASPKGTEITQTNLAWQRQKEKSDVVDGEVVESIPEEND